MGVYSRFNALYGLEVFEEENNGDYENGPRPIEERIEKEVRNGEA